MKRIMKATLAAALALSLLCGVSLAEGGVFGGPSAATPEPIHKPAVPVVDEGGAYSLNAEDYADQWTLVTDQESGVSYYMLDVVYCASPVDPAVEHMAIYAPAAYLQEADGKLVKSAEGSVTSSNGVVYTADTAPILYTNTSGGYSSSAVQDVTIAYMQEGYVQVSVGARGKDTVDAEGHYIGQLPLIMVDLKAGIRYLKANNDVLPGDAERIVSYGYSSGGAVGVMLGASGNSAIYDGYLADIGAADATDDIFIVLGYCPITNLDSADAAYEWFQAGNQEYFLFNAMAVDMYGNDISDQITVGRGNFHPFGDNVLGGAHEDELAAKLYDWYVDYVQSWGFDLGDDGRNGTYFTGLVQLYSDGLTQWLTRYDELTKPDKEKYPDAAAYVQHLYDDYGAQAWLQLAEDGVTATITDYDAFMGSFISRNKMCPSLDSYNKASNEGSAFVDADGNRKHFSVLVRDLLAEMVEEYKDSDAFTAEEYDYIVRLADAYAADVDDEATRLLEIMSPVNYVLHDDATWASTIAPHWRFHIGSADGDHGLPAAWLMHNALLTYAADEIEDSVIEVSWDQPHSPAEIDEQDLYDYIDGIMADALSE